MKPALDSRNFWLLLSAGVLVVVIGLGAAHFMEVHGLAVSGMSIQVVWGLPHGFAIFMVVAASGVLNVASIGSVFGQAAYKPRAPLSGLLSLALLAGGLMVLMLDLGRPERLLVAATHYNFTSVFAWNVILYSGMAAIIAVYLWTMFERRLNGYSQAAGLAALAMGQHRNAQRLRDSERRLADTLEALGIKRGDYVIRVNNRKVLDGVMEAIGLGGEENAGRRLGVLRAIDKFDKFGVEGVKLLLGAGRKDESGDFTKGAGLDEQQIDTIMQAFFRDDWSNPNTTTPEAETDTIDDHVRSAFCKGPRYD